MKAKILAAPGVAGLGVLAEANADEMQLITLPEVVREALAGSQLPSHWNNTLKGRPRLCL